MENISYLIAEFNAVFLFFTGIQYVGPDLIKKRTIIGKSVESNFAKQPSGAILPSL